MSHSNRLFYTIDMMTYFNFNRFLTFDEYVPTMMWKIQI